MPSIFPPVKRILPARDYLIELYLDWANNWLSIENFAEHNGLRKTEAETLLGIAHQVFNTKHPEE